MLSAPQRPVSLVPLSQGPSDDDDASQNQHIGVSRGGRTTKIHAIVDALGNPVCIKLSAGNIFDSVVAESLLEEVPLSGTTVLADKAYGTYALREYIANNDADFCIPPKSNSADPWYTDWHLYKERHLVENFFQKLKEYRRIATRYDKLAKRFLAFIHVACIMIWLA